MDGQHAIIVDDSAVARISAIRAAGKSRLRVAVTGGGCSGFQYEMSMTETVNDDDTVFADSVVVDETSLEILNGSTVSFKDDLIGAQFVIDNPNATASCGCGTSFSVDMG